MSMFVHSFTRSKVNTHTLKWSCSQRYLERGRLVGSGSVVQSGRRSRSYLDLIAKGRRERARFLTIVSGMEKYVRTGSEGGAA